MTLAPAPTTPYVVPMYLGGPLDGGFGAIEPASGVLGLIPRRGGAYELVGFQPPSDWVADSALASVTPDRAVYQWEAVK